MIKKIILVLCLLLAASCVSVEKYNATLGTKYSPEELREDVDYTYKKLQKLHPRLYQFISKKDLDRKFDSVKKSISKPLDAKEFYTILTPVVAEVRQGHISSNFPHQRFTKKERKAIKKTKLDFFELDMRYINEGLWISRTGPKDSVLIGSQVVAVGAETIANILEKYRNTYSTDGYNTTFQNQYIANNFTGIYAKDKGYRDSVSLILMKHDSVFVKQFKRYLKDSSSLKPPTIDSLTVSKKIQLSEADKKARKAKRKYIRKRNKKQGFIKSRKHFLRNFQFLDSTSQIGYLKIRRWKLGPYKKFYKEIFAKLDAAKSEHLIIDLRDNPGGRLLEIHNLYSYLTDSDFQFVEPVEVKTRLPSSKNFYNYNSNVLSLIVQSIVFPFFAVDDLFKVRKKNDKLLMRLKESKISSPNPLNFKGKIYVLINGGSFSASAILATKLQGVKRAICIGEETGGAYNGTVAGQFKNIQLPNSKVSFKFGLMQIQTPHLQQPDGYGVKPDIAILPTEADFLANRDTELEHVLDLIRQEN